MRQKRLYLTSVVLALALALLPPAVLPAEAATYTVTMTTDRDTPALCPVLSCSLREAITNANSDPGSTINFDINSGADPGCAGGVCTLTPNSSLPALTGGSTTIDGKTDPSGDIIEINCSNSNAACLRINSASNTIKGLVINSCPWAGVLISGETADDNKILGCYIGTDATGGSASGNNGSGVVITDGADRNKTGDSGTGNRNVISANQDDGVWIYGEGTDDNSVAYNYIGTDKNGEVDLGNHGNGIWISNSAGNNKVGSISGGRNVISGNSGDGVRVSDADGNQIVGNYVGTDKDGETSLGNDGDGVRIFNGSQGNIIGGSTIEERNVISGNKEYGVHINGAISNTVQGNYIGTTKSGGSALGNYDAGVLITNGSTNNTIGGDTVSKKNVISGNGTGGSGNGVEISSNANTVQGNYIGLSSGGESALANSNYGVSISGDSNVVKDNVVSGNGGHGLYIDNGPDTQIKGNIIGLHKEAGSPVPNQGCGIYIHSGDRIIIGGQASGDHNTIAGNIGHGIAISPTTGTISGTVVMGNLIGTNPLNWSWVGNSGVGVYLYGLYGEIQYSVIGGDEAGEENVISGNNDSGVVIEGSFAHHNTVSRNYIGLNSDGSSKLSNGQHGVEIRFGASYNTVGGGGVGRRNYISGNIYGVAIYTHSDIHRPHDNQVKDNYIGTNKDGTLSLSNTTGVAIFGHSRKNTVADNLISGNDQYGIYLSGDDTYENTVRGNTIGTNAGGADLHNTSHGIYLNDGARTNEIGPSNVIAFNDGDGVHVDGFTTRSNTITATQIYNNAFKGIENINGGNNELTPPVIIGTGPVAGTACANCVVQVFSDDEDEGRIYHGSTMADATGNFTYTDSVSGPYVTATTIDSSGNTSEFSVPVEAEGSGAESGDIYLPIITKNYH